MPTDPQIEPCPSIYLWHCRSLYTWNVPAAIAMQSSECTRLDDTFGPHAANCRGGFDFTLQFEETILSLSPLAILLIIAPLRIFYLFKKEKKVIHSPVLSLKLVCLPPTMLEPAVRFEPSSSAYGEVTHLSSLLGLLARIWSTPAGTSRSLGPAIRNQDQNNRPNNDSLRCWLSVVLFTFIHRTCVFRPAFSPAQCISLR